MNIFSKTAHVTLDEASYVPELLSKNRALSLQPCERLVPDNKLANQEEQWQDISQTR